MTTNQALSTQEPLITSYVNKMITQLRSLIKKGTNPIDLQE